MRGNGGKARGRPFFYLNNRPGTTILFERVSWFDYTENGNYVC